MHDILLIHSATDIIILLRRANRKHEVIKIIQFAGGEFYRFSSRFFLAKKKQNKLKVFSPFFFVLNFFPFYCNFKLYTEKFVLITLSSDFQFSTQCCMENWRKSFLIFGVVNTTREEFCTGGVVFDVEQERLVDNEFSGLSSEFVDQFNLSCRPCGCSWKDE